MHTRRALAEGPPVQWIKLDAGADGHGPGARTFALGSKRLERMTHRLCNLNKSFTYTLTFIEDFCPLWHGLSKNKDVRIQKCYAPQIIRTVAKNQVRKAPYREERLKEIIKNCEWYLDYLQ